MKNGRCVGGQLVRFRAEREEEEEEEEELSVIRIGETRLTGNVFI